MSYSVKYAPLSARFGTGFAQGLAEQVPKEIERYRLASGLKDFANKSGDQTMMQNYAQLLSIPGVAQNPQLLQTFGELAKQEGIRNAYAKKGNQTENQSTSSTPKSNFDIKSHLMKQALNQKPAQTQQEQSNLSRQSNQPTLPSNMPRMEEAKANPPAASENPLSEQFIPPSPWTQQRQESSINEAFDRGIARTFDEASNYANQQRTLYEQAPEKYREQLDYKKSVDNEVDDLFDKDMQIRLQKEGKETYKDLTGDLQLNLKKLARNSVATGKMTPKQAAEYYSKKALDLVKDKGRVLEIANRDIFDRLIPHKKDESIKNLMNISKRFDDLGSSEDFYNLLKTDNVNDTGRQEGLGLSPGGAAIIAYPRTENVKNLIKETKISSKNPQESTREFAQNLFKQMTPKDSFLAIARQMKHQDSNFDEYAFFDYLRENTDQYGSNARLNREVDQGVSDFFPNWRDIGLFPAFTRPVSND